MDASPRPAAYSGDFEYEDKAAPPPPPQSPAPRRPHSSSAAADPRSPTLRTRHSEPELRVPPRDSSDEYPRFEARKRMSADFSDDTMSVGSIGGESPKSDRGSWRLHSAVAGPFLTGPLAKDFQSEHLKTPRGKARDDINFDYSGLLFPLAPVIDAIPDTPRGGYGHQTQSFTDISQFDNSSASMDGFHLDGGGAGYTARRAAPNAFQAHNSQFYPGHGAHGSDASHQQAANGQYYNHGSAAAQQQSSAIVATQSGNAHGANYGDVVARNGGAASEQSLVASSGTDSLESLSKGMADSMAQILAKTQNGRSYNEVQLTSLVQKIHLHMNIMGRTSAAIREDYNRIKAKLEQTITDKKVLEATNYHLQQLVQQYEVERQYFHQYVLHSLQSQSSLIYESMGNLSQNVEQSRSTIEELSVRLSRELANIQGSRGNDSQLKDILEEIKRVVDVSAITGAQQANGAKPNKSPTSSPQPVAKPVDSEPKRVEEVKGGGFRLTPVLLAILLWIATLGGVYISAKSAALSELQEQTQPASSSSSILPKDLDRIVDQISQKLESTIEPSEVRKLVYTELKQNSHLIESDIDDATKSVPRETPQHADEKEEKVKPQSHLPEIAVSPSEPSVPISATDIEEPKSVASESTHEEAVPKVEDKVTPAEPTVESSGFPSTSAPEVVPEIKDQVVEVEVPPTDQFQVPDAAIAEMLRLNGLPVDAIPFDTIPGVIHPPAEVIVESEKPSEPSAKSALEADATMSKSDSSGAAESVVGVVEVPESVVETNAAAPVAPAEASVNVVEVAIENPLNPEVIVREEALSSTNVTSGVEPAVIEKVIAADAVHSSIVTDASSSTEANDSQIVAQANDRVETLPEPVLGEVAITKEKRDEVAEESIDVIAPVAPTEVGQPVTSTVGEAIKDDSADSKVETAIPLTESTGSGTTTESTGTSIEQTSTDKPTESAAVDVGASVPSEDAAAVETITSNDAHVTEKIHEVASDDAGTGSVLDTITGSAPFTGLSKALRSLAQRFVEGGEVSDTSGEETVSESEDVADYESGSTEPTSIGIADDVKREENVVADTTNAASDPSVTLAEPDSAASESSVESAKSIEGSQLDAVEPVSIPDIASKTESATESNSDVVTVEVNAGGEVAADLSVSDTVQDVIGAIESEKSVELETPIAEDAAEDVSDDGKSKDVVEDNFDVIGQETPAASAVPETSTADDVVSAADNELVDASTAASVEVTEEASVADKSETATKDDASDSVSVIDAGSASTAATLDYVTEVAAESEVSKEPTESELSKEPAELEVSKEPAESELSKEPAESELSKEPAAVAAIELPAHSETEAHLDIEGRDGADETASSSGSDASTLLSHEEAKENVETSAITNTLLVEDAIPIPVSADEERRLLEELDAMEAKSASDKSPEHAGDDAAVSVTSEIDAGPSVAAADAESPINSELAVDVDASSVLSATDGVVGSVEAVGDSSASSSATSSDGAAPSTISTPTESESTKDKADESDPVVAAINDSEGKERDDDEVAAEGAQPSEPSTDATAVDEVAVAGDATVDSIAVVDADDVSVKTAKGSDEETYSTADAIA